MTLTDYEPRRNRKTTIIYSNYNGDEKCDDSAEARPNITTKPSPATIVTIQVPVPILSGMANNGLGIQKSITNKITLMSFGCLTVPSVNKEINNPKDS